MDLFSRNPVTDKCIILDIDETLVHTFNDMKYLHNLNIMNDPKKLDIKSRCYIINFKNVDHIKNKVIDEGLMWGIFRPRLQEFLDFCFDYFRIVAVWSAGKYDYVHKVVDKIFANTYYPDIIYTREDCVGPIGNLEKPISKMINENPQLRNVMFLENTFIIDDRTISFAQDPTNGILIPPYTPENYNEIPVLEKMQADDTTFYKLMRWFSIKDVATSSDVRTLNKNNIWNLDITSDNSKEFNEIFNINNNIQIKVEA